MSRNESDNSRGKITDVGELPQRRLIQRLWLAVSPEMRGKVLEGMTPAEFVVLAEAAPDLPGPEVERLCQNARDMIKKGKTPLSLESAEQDSLVPPPILLRPRQP